MTQKQTSSKCGRFDLSAQSASRWIEDTVRPVIALEGYGAASKLLLGRAAGARKQMWGHEDRHAQDSGWSSYVINRLESWHASGPVDPTFGY
jgi:hypothetical protein